MGQTADSKLEISTQAGPGTIEPPVDSEESSAQSSAGVKNLQKPNDELLSNLERSMQATSGKIQHLIDLEESRARSSHAEEAYKRLQEAQEELAMLEKADLPYGWRKWKHPRTGDRFYVNDSTKMKQLVHPLSSSPPLSTDEAPRFYLEDPAALAHLCDRGYVVIREALTGAEVSTAHGCLWQFLSDCIGWKRGDMQTWNARKLADIGLPFLGIVKAGGAGQSELAWYVRTNPVVRKAFARLWGTDDLLSSFDGFNIFLPWHHGFQKTESGWLHVDQGCRKQGLYTIQGFVSLTDQNATTGGLLVVPGSHHLHEHWVTKDVRNSENDFVHVPHDCTVRKLPQRLVACKAGDLVLWDSRLVHCNTPAVEQPISVEGELLRACVYTCMVPKSRADEDVLEARRKAYEKGMSCNHWPLIRQADLAMFDNCGPSHNFTVRGLDEVNDGRKDLVC